jgi:SAM-dependent methyltransferase
MPIERNTRDMGNPQFWDSWWEERISKRRTAMFMFPIVEAPMIKYGGTYVDVVNSDDLLLAIMTEYGLKKVLCAGNGLSQEPRALARAGYDVTALDLSPKASELAKTHEFSPNDFNYFYAPGAERPGGHLDFVVGNLLDTAVCPGPFDVIIERLTVQLFPEQDRPKALQALAGRLGNVGIFLSHCNDGAYPSKHRQHFHASESWFREQGWMIWDSAPATALSGRVAWLLRSSG